METEFQASFEQLLWFVNAHLANTGVGGFENSQVKIVFNRNVLINTTELIQQCRDSDGIISTRTLLAHHPFIDDVDAELSQIEEEKQQNLETYGEFPLQVNTDKQNNQKNDQKVNDNEEH